MSARLQPVTPPFPAGVQAHLDRLMPAGVSPLVLFTTLARDTRLFQRFMSGGLLDRGHLSLRQREVAIARVTASCRSEYEWGVHVAFFGNRVGLDDAQLRSLVYGGPDDDCWSEEDRLVIRLCDSLHTRCDIDDELWDALAGCFTADAMIELIMLAGLYRMVSYLTNGLRLPLESFAARFPV